MQTIKLLRDESPYLKLEILGQRLAQGINRIAAERSLPIHCAQRGSMFTPFFRREPVTNLIDSKACDQQAHAAYFHHMLANGVYLPPSAFEAYFLNDALSASDIDFTIEALKSWNP